MKRTLWLVLAMVCLAVSLPLLVWGFWPPHREMVTVPLVVPAGMPSLADGRMIRLTFSPAMRAGDSQIVELNLSAGEAGGGVDEGYRVITEARLELPLANVRPAEVVSAALVEGSGATFYWEVTPRETGDLSGTVWLYLRFVPKTGGEGTRQPVSAQLIGVSTRSMLGRTGSQARVAGVVGGLIGLVGILGWRRTSL